MKGKRNEEAFQRDKECLAAFKQQENDGELALYYFDESGFSTTPSVPYGWQRIGETRRIPCHRSRRVNVLGFLSRSNDLFFHTAEQAVTTDTVVAAFDAFVEGYASKHQETGIPCLVVLDNASIHRSGMFKEKLTGWLERGVRVYFLPPYSPELNLIEILSATAPALPYLLHPCSRGVKLSTNGCRLMLIKVTATSKNGYWKSSAMSV